MSDVAARNRRNRAAGKRWESDLRDGLRDESFDVEKLQDTGARDEGDLVVRLTRNGSTEFVVIEAKAGALHAAEFAREAALEAKHFAEHRKLDRSTVKGIAIVKQRGKGWRQGYVLTTVEDYFGLTA